jgi:hypothetical protein
MRIIFLISALSLLVACATPYQGQEGSIRGGFSELRLDTDSFRVSFAANGYSNAQTARDYALLRSAEVTLENGFTHFLIKETTESSGGIGHKPSVTNIILCFKGKPEHQGTIYEAKQIVGALYKQYEIERPIQ